MNRRKVIPDLITEYEKSLIRKKERAIKKKQLVKQKNKNASRLKTIKKEQAERVVTKLKSKMTDQELILSDILFDRSIIFESQKAFYNKSHLYIVDFFIQCTDGTKLVIEIDGSQHYTTEGKKRDFKRTRFLIKKFGVVVLRYPNSDITNRLGSVLSELESFNLPKYF